MANLPVPVPYSWSVGDTFTAAIGNTTRDALLFLISPPAFLGVQTIAQSLPNGTWTALALDTAPLDSYGGHSTTSNTSRYVAPVTGWYTCAGVACISQNGTGPRGARLHVNGAPVQGTGAFIPSGAGVDMAVPTPTRDVRLNAGDVLEVAAYQNCGNPLNTAVYSDIASALWARWSHV
ncbi:hypothetical protein ACFC1T_02250 [Kitasatospora sp. NPDC056076]|uniref:hypothetical protein n=1 Tax=Kitasatospora sp. NPDC056076 TaxID=3345703 RepID=UPI0035E2BE2A